MDPVWSLVVHQSIYNSGTIQPQQDGKQTNLAYAKGIFWLRKLQFYTISYRDQVCQILWRNQCRWRPPDSSYSTRNKLGPTHKVQQCGSAFQIKGTPVTWISHCYDHFYFQVLKVPVWVGVTLVVVGYPIIMACHSIRRHKNLLQNYKILLHINCYKYTWHLYRYTLQLCRL